MDKDDVIRVFPEIQKIKDESLKEKVAAVWREATGGNIEIVKKIIMPEAKRKISLVDHTRRITQMAMAVAIVRRDVNMDWLIAGAILHDVGIAADHRLEGGELRKNESLLEHDVSSVLLCSKHGLPKEVIHIVSMHEEEEGHKIEEAIILKHCAEIENEIAVLERKRT
ncbi:MAG: HDIG domain-containing protein [Thermoplasmata archaeon]|nr:HDIG domain-containing protein [Thermoplasmata archaeon]